MSEAQEEVTTAQALYNKLDPDRLPFIERARRAAELTVPYLVPPEGSSGTTDYAEPSQSLGARGVRHLASTTMLTLFPPNAPFFKYQIDDISMDEITEENRGVVEAALNKRERAVMAEVNASGFRPHAFEAGRQLIVAGNYLLYVPYEGKIKGFPLTNYVVRRDASGNLLDIVIKESIAKSALPEEVLGMLPPELAEKKRDDELEVFTRVSWSDVDQVFLETQEISGVTITDEKSAGKYPKDKLPYVVLRFTAIAGEDYGRGLVEELIGDLNSLDALTTALREGTVQGAKVVWMVDPASGVQARTLSKASNGDFVQGKAVGVTPLRLDKQSDFAVAERYIQSITERLSFSFMLHTAIQRKGERVTAEEVRYMAAELDKSLGGVYTLLADELQMPVVKLFEVRMEKSRKVPPLPDGVTSTAVITGIDALGRGNDLQNLDLLVAGLQQILGAEGTMRYLNGGEYIKRRGASLGIDMDGLIRTDEEIAQSEQQAQMERMIQHLGPQALQQAGNMGKEQMKAQGEAPNATE